MKKIDYDRAIKFSKELADLCDNFYKKDEEVTIEEIYHGFGCFFTFLSAEVDSAGLPLLIKTFTLLASSEREIRTLKEQLAKYQKVK